MVVDYFDYILGKLGESKTKRERFVTTDLNLVKAVRELWKRGLIQYRLKMQPAQPFGLICHDDGLNTLSDWAEKMICQLTGAKQTAWNCKGHDGVLSDGTKIEVKYARWKQHKTNKKWKFRFGNLKSKVEFNLLIAGLADPNRPHDISKSTFYVIPSDEVEQNLSGKQNEIYVWENSKLHKKLNQYYKCTFEELVELQHGYEHFLKMKGKVRPVESPKESIQFVIDAWEPNKYGLMPFDERYEDSSWHAEFVVAHFLKGKVTEQRCAGYDVVDNDEVSYQVKIANISPANYTKSGVKYQILFNAIKTNNEYDVFLGLFWDSLELKETNNMNDCKVIMMTKEVAEVLKTPYHADKLNNGALKFSTKSDGKYHKNAAIHKFRPFMFTIDHIAELGQIGWNNFYDKYLKEACEEALQKYGKGAT